MTSYVSVRHCRPAPRLSGFARLLQMFALRRQRHQLSGLSDAQLRDIGLTSAQASQEASRKPWDVPATWRN
ncbi:DUF1127 domain-containing protein [Yoonia sp. 208BN28-4]|uniref:DUF1127 domain-containing protein n=1 Tax=Yoonia sp. 208BN28-4 TaxID=3126505 RepID=UPI0030999654